MVPLRQTALALALAGVGVASWAQEIYTCVDAKGRKLTSDRPIMECLDREQKVLASGGTTVKRVVRTLTAAEQAELDEQHKREAEEQARLAEEKRKDRALFARYPNEAAHQKERAGALLVIEALISTAQTRVVELKAQRRDLDSQLEFYQKDPNRAPAMLKHRLEENGRNMAAQHRFIQDQEEERRRINQRFDEEAARLRPRWPGSGALARAASTPAASATGLH